MSTRRTTRASSARLPTPAAPAMQGSPPESPYDFGATPRQDASLRARRSTTRRARSPDAAQHVVLREPKGADTPDMQSRFDNSYGNNSFIGLESAAKRRGTNVRVGFDDEDEEDRRFQEQLRGKPGKYIGQQNLNEAIDETRKEAARETEPVEDSGQTLVDNDQDLSDPLMLDDPESQADSQDRSSSEKAGNPLEGQMLPPPLPASLMQPSPESPSRLDSSRSFNNETGLFEDATLHTPVREPTKAKPNPVDTQTREQSNGLSPRNWLPNAFSRTTLPFVRSSLRKTTASLRHNAGLPPVSRTSVNPEQPEMQQVNTGSVQESSTETSKGTNLADGEVKTVMEMVLRRRGQLKDETGDNFHPLDDLSFDETEEIVTYITQTGRSRAAARRICKALPSIAGRAAASMAKQNGQEKAAAVPETQERQETREPTPVNRRASPAKERANTPQRNATPARSPVSLGEVPHKSSRSRGSTPASPSVPTFSDRILRQYMMWSNRIASCLSILGVFCVVALISSLIMIFLQAAVAPADAELSTFTNFKHSVAEVLPTPVQQILSEGDLSHIWSRLKQHDSAIARLSSDDASIRKTIESFKSKLPDRIYITTNKAGKPEITQDFWHALRDKIKADDVILTLENAKKKSPEIPDTLWRAVKSRLDADEVARGIKNKEGSGISTDDLEKVVDSKLTKSWEGWQARNDAALRDLLANTVKGTAVQRDEFVALLEKEVSTYRQEIQRELVGVNSRLAAFQQDFEKLGKQSPPGGMTKREVQAMISSTIDRLVSQGGLDAIANGQIRGHAASELFNQVNFFSLGSGAVVDPGMTSKAWTPPASSFKSKKYMDRDGYKPQPASTVLKSWTDENECFCAAPLPNTRQQHGSDSGSTNGPAHNVVSVLLSRDIVPQHLVVEHILPGATLNPGATPRTIEVWAYIEEMNLRREVEVFSRTHFPNTPSEKVLNEGFQKIGQFTYEQSGVAAAAAARGGSTGPVDRGMQVFKMSDELSQMGAVTNHVVVRALDNYGADHTCFYRLRLYGEMPGQGGRGWSHDDMGSATSTGGGQDDSFGWEAGKSKDQKQKKGWFS